MASFDAAAEVVFPHEGGEFDHPDDPGGHTMFGVTEERAAMHGLRPEDVTPEIARHIAKTDYWDEIKLDQVESQLVATKLLDIHYSTGWGAHAAQLSIRVLATMRENAMRVPAADLPPIERFEGLLIHKAVDGVMGPLTMGAMNAFTRTYGKAFLHELGFWHANRYHGVRTVEAQNMVERIETLQAWRDSFMRGWIPRALKDQE